MLLWWPHQSWTNIFFPPIEKNQVLFHYEQYQESSLMFYFWWTKSKAVGRGVLAPQISQPPSSRRWALGDLQVPAVFWGGRWRLECSEDEAAEFLGQALASGEAMSHTAPVALNKDLNYLAHIIFFILQQGLVKAGFKLDFLISFVGMGIHGLISFWSGHQHCQKPASLSGNPPFFFCSQCGSLHHP